MPNLELNFSGQPQQVRDARPPLRVTHCTKSGAIFRTPMGRN